MEMNNDDVMSGSFRVLKAYWQNVLRILLAIAISSVVFNVVNLGFAIAHDHGRNPDANGIFSNMVVIKGLILAPFWELWGVKYGLLLYTVISTRLILLRKDKFVNLFIAALLCLLASLVQFYEKIFTHDYKTIGFYAVNCSIGALLTVFFHRLLLKRVEFFPKEEPKNA